jgi:phospholipid-binding lipoprotein MlaA
MSSIKSGKFIAAFAALFLLAGCATPPPNDDPDAVAEFKQINDPLEPLNRGIFDFNQKLYDYGLTPAAKAYRYVVPQWGRQRVADLLNNLKSPVTLINDLLQGNVSRGGVTIARFVLNTTFGVGGIMDVATPMGIPGHPADAGETLAVWGAGEGFYLVLPLFGPSNPRDGIGLGADSLMDPLSWYLNDNHLRWLSTTRFLANGLSAYESHMDQFADVKRSSLDYYSAMRSLYRQYRAAQIEDAKNGHWAPEDPNTQQPFAQSQPNKQHQ